MNYKNKKEKPIILFKYGGNAMTDNSLKRQILNHICSLTKKGFRVVLVHGGGPFIKELLETAKVESEFIDGHRKTTKEAYDYVEMALKGKVNGNLISLINAMGYKAVGLSGKDGQTITAFKRMHKRITGGKEEEIDLGQVGDVADTDTTLIELLLDNEFIPVITCLASDKEGNDYNINGDMFAGHLAGALGVQQYVVLTDVDGLLEDKDKPETLINEISLSGINQLLEKKIIQGGMIPKLESCGIAINKGADYARIINGTKPEQIQAIIENRKTGTLINK